MNARRLVHGPILLPHMDERMGDNLNGPSLIRTPEWLPNRLGRYYLYFAHHSGKYIRLAYADQLEGPWTIYEPGTLHLAEAGFKDHIASPDVHIDEDNRRIAMFFHGAFLPIRPRQATRVAFSGDGIRFTTQMDILGKAYWRVFRYQDRHYALAKPGLLFRSPKGELWRNFEQGPQIFPAGEPAMRHLAVHRVGDILHVFYSRIGDCPERIVHSRIHLAGDWETWCPSPPRTVLSPEFDWEGADLPVEPSSGGQAKGRVRQLRDPAIYAEGNDVYLLYSVAGEHGIAIAEIDL